MKMMSRICLGCCTHSAERTVWRASGTLNQAVRIRYPGLLPSSLCYAEQLNLTSLQKNDQCVDPTYFIYGLEDRWGNPLIYDNYLWNGMILCDSLHKRYILTLREKTLFTFCFTTTEPGIAGRTFITTASLRIGIATPQTPEIYKPLICHLLLGW
jgi:hypothetical protein